VDLELVATEEGGRSVLTLTGAVDVESRVPLRAAALKLIDDLPVGLVLDMSGVTFMDSTGIGALVDVGRSAQDAGISFTIRRPSARVVRTLEAAGLTDVWDVESDPD
jgi:anti-sigma B factor antagonist